MQLTDWASEHSDALREYLAKGMSYSEIARAINARFKTAYSRSAAIGRASRMGLAGLDRAEDLPMDLPKHWPAPPKAPQPQLRKPRGRHVAGLIRPMPTFERTEILMLIGVAIEPPLPTTATLLRVRGGI